MSVYTNIANNFTIYVGSVFFIVGILGNIINACIFYKNHRNPSTLLLFVASCFNFIDVFIGILTRLMSAGLNIDVAANSLGWCKARYFLIQFCALTSFSTLCYATIDQYFITSQSETLRRLSKISNVRRVLCILILFWILYSIPLALFSSLTQLSDGRTVCVFSIDLGYIRFASYFGLPVVWGIAPISILIIFGILTYRNISLLRNARNRDEAHRHLTSMILLHIIFIVFGTLPYAFYYTYSAITLFTAKTTDRKDLETCISNIVAVILYCPNSCAFLVYYVASATYQKQVKKFLHIPDRATQIAPVPSATIEPNTRPTI
ncbi:unnamed protein product [Adineta steineri]|uniref:G-protein coupled receptors family 1 profile domain-containing protein n=1 Tax=Adineta steineri TaxID=433720 RepID=A0A815CXC0_9BILA|nr:unnamed protein product [Adineta steineri]CAF3760945.1 unnamed protein product [Adineta steineri]